MKILFIISSLSSGGAERVTVNLANYLSKKYEVYIATFSNDDSYYVLDDKVNHIKLNLLKVSQSKLDSLKNTFFRIKALYQIMEKVDADIQISFMTHTNIISIIASKLANKKIIISERTVYDFYNSRAINMLRRLTYSFADALIAQTKADRKHYQLLSNVKVIYNPLQVKGMPIQKEKIVLAVGRLDRQKGFDNLIEIFSQIDTDWQLLIAGDGQDRKKLEERRDKLKAKNIHLAGKQKNIENYYMAASIFVLSSQKEGFPNVLIEAMAYGCAVVSFDCPYGPAEIIEDGVNGILVENQNRIKMKEAIEKLINDQALREKYADEATKVREKYSVEKIAKEWENAISEVKSD